MSCSVKDARLKAEVESAQKKITEKSQGPDRVEKRQWNSDLQK